MSVGYVKSRPTNPSLSVFVLGRDESSKALGCVSKLRQSNVYLCVHVICAVWGLRRV